MYTVKCIIWFIFYWDWVAEGLYMMWHDCTPRGNYINPSSFYSFSFGEKPKVRAVSTLLSEWEKLNKHQAQCWLLSLVQHCRNGKWAKCP